MGAIFVWNDNEVDCRHRNCNRHKAHAVMKVSAEKTDNWFMGNVVVNSLQIIAI